MNMEKNITPLVYELLKVIHKTSIFSTEPPRLRVELMDMKADGLK